MQNSTIDINYPLLTLNIQDFYAWKIYNVCKCYYKTWLECVSDGIIINKKRLLSVAVMFCRNYGI